DPHAGSFSISLLEPEQREQLSDRAAGAIQIASTALARSRMQLGALLCEPLLTLRFLIRARAASFRRLLAQPAEDQISLEAVLQERNTGGRSTARWRAETRERVQHALSVFLSRLPVGVGRHVEDRAQPDEALAYELRNVRTLALLQHSARGRDDCLGRLLPRDRLRLLCHFLEVTQVFV